MLSYLSTWVELWCARLEVRSGVGYAHQHWQELGGIGEPIDCSTTDSHNKQQDGTHDMIQHGLGS